MSGGISRAARRQHFTVVADAAINDECLTFRARGILTYVLSKPDNWSTRAEAIAQCTPGEGRDAVRTALRELEQAGYLVRTRVQGPDGRWSTHTEIHETPQRPATGNQSSGEGGGPTAGNPSSVRPADIPPNEQVAPMTGQQVVGSAVPNTKIDYSREQTRGLPEVPDSLVDAAQPAPPRCDAHDGMADAPPCRACARVREQREATERDHRARAAERHRQERERATEVRSAAIADCDLCDTNGYAGLEVCTHDPLLSVTRDRGLTAMYAAMGWDRKGPDAEELPG